MSWRQYEYYERPHFRFGPKITDTVKTLIIINVVIFLSTYLTQFLREGRFWNLIMDYFSVVPSLVIKKLYLWQFVTYMFLHGGIWHILINMFILWMLGSEVERHMGKRDFIRLYLFTGIGAALCHLLFNWRSPIPMIGASGAVFGVLIAFAMIFPERYITLLIFFFLPVTIKAKYLALGLAGIELLSTLSAAKSPIAHFAHLGGIFFGYLYMRFVHHLPLPFAFSSQLWWSLRNRFLRIRLKKSRNRYKPIDSDEFISREIDPILEKISKHGIKSLSRREKRILKKFRSRTK